MASHTFLVMPNGNPKVFFMSAPVCMDHNQLASHIKVFYIYFVWFDSTSHQQSFS